MQCSRDGTSLRVYLGTRISHMGSIAFAQGNPRKSASIFMQNRKLLMAEPNYNY